MRIRALGVGLFCAVPESDRCLRSGGARDLSIHGRHEAESMAGVRRAALAIAAASVLATLAPGAASAVLFTGSSGTFAASADFTFSSGTLTVVLSNVSSADITTEARVLTAVFFSIDTTATLTPVSAILTAGSTVFYDPDGQPAGGVVGGEWAYKKGLSGAPQGANAGISSAGFSGGVSFGTADLFPGSNLAGPLGPDGIQYGILSAGDNTATGTLHIFGGMIKNSVTFQLSGATADDFASIKDVSFQYGRNLTDTNLIGVPEPSTALLVAAGLIALAVRRRSARAG